MHDKGYAILIPRDQEELAYANALVLPENEVLVSRLAVMSVRRIVLVLISSKSADSPETLRAFFEDTFFWYQVRDRNPTRLDELVRKVDDAISWLVEHKMLKITDATIVATEFGLAVSRTGLLPSTAFQFAELLKDQWHNLEKHFEEFELPLIHAAVCSDEFNPDRGQRFLPPLDRTVGYAETRDALYAAPLFKNMHDCEPAENQAAYAVFLFICGEAERKIGARAGVPSGQVHRFSGDSSRSTLLCRSARRFPRFSYSRGCPNRSPRPLRFRLRPLLPSWIASRSPSRKCWPKWSPCWIWTTSSTPAYLRQGRLLN